MIFRNHSNMLIYYQCWKHLCSLIIIIFLTGNTFLRILWWIKSSKEQHLFKTFFSNNISLYYHFFIDLKHAFWIKVLISFKKKKEKNVLTPNFWMVVYIVKKKKKKQFGADPDIYMDKRWWNSDNCNVNMWEFYNNIADTYIKLYKYQLSIYISNKMSY